MSAIAYITDSKMLDFHRLNINSTMNFWRLSNKISFSDFGENDLVFFLSKDKKMMNKGEKGIVGFGRVDKIFYNSPNTLWKKFKKANGYNSFSEFKKAIMKVSKNHKLPSKISSFYLKNVVFFQTPIYLSECGVSLSNKLESYIYIKPEEAVIKLLDFAQNNIDMWSRGEDTLKLIKDEQLEYALKLVHNMYGDFKFSKNEQLRAKRTMARLKKLNPLCSYVASSKMELSYVKDGNVLIVLYNNKNVDKRLLIGQAELYKKYIGKYYPYSYKLYFKTSDSDKNLETIINKG